MPATPFPVIWWTDVDINESWSTSSRSIRRYTSRWPQRGSLKLHRQHTHELNYTWREHRALTGPERLATAPSAQILRWRSGTVSFRPSPERSLPTNDGGCICWQRLYPGRPCCDSVRHWFVGSSRRSQCPTRATRPASGVTGPRYDRPLRPATTRRYRPRLAYRSPQFSPAGDDCGIPEVSASRWRSASSPCSADHFRRRPDAPGIATRGWNRFPAASAACLMVRFAARCSSNHRRAGHGYGTA